MLPMHLSMPMSIPMMPMPFPMPPPGAPAGATPGPQSQGGFPPGLAPQTLSFPLAAPSPQVPNIPMPHTGFPQPLAPQQAKVSVGNASLAAFNSKEPPKFSCVLLAGPPAVGKTTLGRELVNSFKADGLGWAFFSGADFLPEGSTKHSLWEKTKDVFDALSKRLDALLEQQKLHRTIKGLIIDKNLRGIEDLYYLTMLLQSKNIPFVGIIGMECADNDTLIRRMSGGDELREKLKYHHVIHARVASLAKMAFMYRVVDASKTEKEVVQNLRTISLGFCVQPPTKGIRTHYYEESHSNVIVDSYEEYYRVMIALFECVSVRGFHFPTSTLLVPFSTKEMTDKARLNAIKTHYRVRKKPEGTHYLLLYVNEKMYLIPPHMRAVLLMTGKPWMGKSLDNIASFVLEGILTRFSRNRHKEFFLVYDIIFWSEKNQPSNNISMRMLWDERQAILQNYLLSEEKVTFSNDVDCVIAYQSEHKLSNTLNLLDSEEYASEGIVLQPTQLLHRSDHVLLWRPPDSITADFRVGGFIRAHETQEPSLESSIKDSITSQSRLGTTFSQRHSMDDSYELPCRTYALEVYNKFEKKYVQYESATVVVRHSEIVQGSIITCRLQGSGLQQSWTFSRIRYDLVRPDYLHDVKELLQSCLIPRSQFVSWLITEQIVASEIPHASPADTAKAAPPPSYGIAMARLAPDGPPSRTSAADFPLASHFPKASEILTRGTTQAVGPAAEAPSQLQLLASIVPSLHIVRKGNSDVRPPTPPTLTPSPSARQVSALSEETAKGVAPSSPPSQRCAQCHYKKQRDDLRIDKRDRRYYCYNCWAKTGYGFCVTCGEFAKGDRATRGGRKGNLVCSACNQRSEIKPNAPKGSAVVSSQHDEGDTVKSNRKQKRQNVRDTTTQTTVEQKDRVVATESRKTSRRDKKNSKEAANVQGGNGSVGSSPKDDPAFQPVSQAPCESSTMVTEVSALATDTPEPNHKPDKVTFPTNVDTVKKDQSLQTNVDTARDDQSLPTNVDTVKKDQSLQTNVDTARDGQSLQTNVDTARDGQSLPTNVDTVREDQSLPTNVDTVREDQSLPTNVDTVREDQSLPTNGRNVPTPQAAGNVASTIDSDIYSEINDQASKKSGMCSQQ
ncbi:unnamed protein product [Phytomonas sp. Hart1]|nr:unnamed protein product [Phytomonas sp. Hart1]|eukprot:CCW71312.1 unnamed protein product [Phytomonas sp. isolate Hart1]